MRTQLHKKESGHLGQYEDWWYLIDEGGERYVSHEWDHVRVNGGDTNQGSTRIELDEFLKSGNDKAVARLKELIA